MITDLAIFIKDSWELVCANALTFIVFAVICLGIGSATSWAIHSYFLSLKLHNIPERKVLQSKIHDLEEEIVGLKKSLHRQDVKDLIQESLKSDLNKETIGDVIVKNK